MQTIHGPGFAFETPASWRLSHTLTSATARGRGAVPATVSVVLYQLAEAYSPARFEAAAKQLDLIARRLAARAGGKVTLAETTRLGGREIRDYRFTSRRGENRIGFLLVGRRELQLLCQAPQGGDPDGACAMLFETLRLTG